MRKARMESMMKRVGDLCEQVRSEVYKDGHYYPAPLANKPKRNSKSITGARYLRIKTVTMRMLRLFGNCKTRG